MNERRMDQRYQLGNNCIINHEDQVGTIVDLGKGGLSCICLASNSCSEGTLKQVDIFCLKDNLLAQGLKVKKLSSEVIPGKYIENIKTRRCRIQFDQLHDDQSVLLENIILTYAMH